MNTSNDVVNEIAKRVHEAMVWATEQPGPAQDWQGGNSIAEDKARSTASRIAALTKPDDEGLTLLREAWARLRAIQGACGDYLPPDSGISEHDLVNTVIGLTDDKGYVSLAKRIDTYLKGQSTNREEEVRAAWQPIETVPDDGVFDVWCVAPESEQVTGFTMRKINVERVCGRWFATTFEQQFFTHWMKSPEPPQATRNGETK